MFSGTRGELGNYSALAHRAMYRCYVIFSHCVQLNMCPTKHLVSLNHYYVYLLYVEVAPMMLVRQQAQAGTTTTHGGNYYYAAAFHVIIIIIRYTL